MSLRSVPATGLDNVRSGLSPCLGVAITDSLDYEQSGVQLNETLEIVFLGTPPFNLTSTICDNNSTCWCGTQSQNLSMNTFTWTVGGVNVNDPNTRDDSQIEVFTTLGQSIIWAAVEVNNISLTQAQYSYSPNFSLSSSSSDDQPSGAPSPRLNQGSLGLVTLGILSLAILGVLAGL